MRVPLHPSLKLSDGDEYELARKNHLELGLHLSLEVIDADPERVCGLLAREGEARDRLQRASRGLGHH
jgi:hypothetical protein